MCQSDPTDHALAAIASILDHPQENREPEKTAVEEMLVRAELVEADGYHKFGPGPMPAIRFKWTVRRGDNGEFFVDETIGENSRPSPADRCRGMPPSGWWTTVNTTRGGGSISSRAK